MRILIKTPVSGHFRNVFARFDRTLFEALKPPGMRLEILRFDGSKKGDIVHLRLTIAGIIRQEWVSKITEETIQDHQAWFVDEGEHLPGFLRYWRHRHLVEENGSGSSITDDITFRTPFLLLDYLMYPVMYLHFAIRRPIYRKFFKQ
ncbi:MAG: hypothetical protein SF052_19015 [Bacteroidia bacterium]|nr:hypothetical protein [Bacteroidia bacterium]